MNKNCERSIAMNSEMAEQDFMLCHLIFILGAYNKTPMTKLPLLHYTAEHLSLIDNSSC